MRISLYTTMRNCLEADYPCVEMLRHHLPLADEIVVNEGFSTDGTYEAISRIDPKIRIFRTNWAAPAGEDWWIQFRDAARRRCEGDWCIHLDSDEFIPEWEFEPLRRHLETTADLLVPVEFTNFYGNYRVFMARLPKIIPDTGLRIHRNLPEIEVWGDGANVHMRGHENDPGEIGRAHV